MNPLRYRVAAASLPSLRWEDFKRSAPMTRAFNHLIAGAYFHRRFERWPLPVQDPEATINDVIFSRMIDSRWSTLERGFVDKETAKHAARRLAPDLRVPETLAVFPMEAVRSVEHLFAMLHPFAGTDAIAKPAHASGGVTFLRDLAKPVDVYGLHQLASVDYATILREMQYHGLPRKIIVERMVPDGDVPLDDYKFHCIRGEPLVCQVDHDRFGAAWSRLLHAADFAPMDADDGLVPPDGFRLPAPDRLAAMLSAARALAAPFEFVRVDLYDGADGVYFGELTFTPAASLGIAPSSAGDHRENATHRRYSRIMMDALRAANGGTRE
ncbi:MAG: ATP-grasp fold amidoligase family protein [Sphingomonas sp.]